MKQPSIIININEESDYIRWGIMTVEGNPFRAEFLIQLKKNISFKSSGEKPVKLIESDSHFAIGTYEGGLFKQSKKAEEALYFELLHFLLKLLLSYYSKDYIQIYLTLKGDKMKKLPLNEEVMQKLEKAYGGF